MAGLKKEDMELFALIDAWFEAHRQDIIEDIKRMVRIPSISKPANGDAVRKEGPFGTGCRQAMDEMLSIASEHGFFTENREYYVGTIGLEKKDYDNTIGFWNHLDVVPVGEGWTRPPFEPYINDGFLIGRGVQDNKGPAVGMIYLMQCIRELGIGMNHELCLFVGCDEERGMEDIAYYTSKYETPAISLIADSGFPVCYGEKGIVEGQLLSKDSLKKPVQSVWGGSASNMIPDRACARLDYSEKLLKELESMNERRKAEGGTEAAVRVQGEAYIEVEAYGTSRHSAFPDGSVNAIHELAAFLGQADGIGVENTAVFSTLAGIASEYYGRTEGIDFQDEVSGNTTCAATVLSTENGKMCVNLNIRYAITQDSEELLGRLEAFAVENGLTWRLERDSKPNYFPKEHPAVEYLTRLYNEWQGLDTKAFVMGGGTYARMLPRAFAYGIGGMPRNAEDREREARLFKKGSGGAHEPDEGLNLRMYFEAMKFYTLAVAGLDKLV